MYAKALLLSLKECGISPEAIVDKYTHEKNDSIPILKSVDSLARDSEVYITVLGYPEIYHELRSKGFTQLLLPEDLFDLFPTSLSFLINDGFLWRKGSQCIASESIRKDVLGLMADKKSVRILRNIFDFRQKPSSSNYPHPRDLSLAPMYFPGDIQNLYHYSSAKILDIGAYDGDTLFDFIKFFDYQDNCSISEYTAIEPSPTNMAVLRQKVFNNRAHINFQLQLIEAAVGDEDTYLSLHEGGSASRTSKLEESDLSKSDTTSVRSISIEKILSDSLPNIIKMDIEGADCKILELMKLYIKKHKPTLALSIYHAPDDLWKMPFIVNNFCPNEYLIYIRQEGHWGLETQLYAIPKILL